MPRLLPLLALLLTSACAGITSQVQGFATGDRLGPADRLLVLPANAAPGAATIEQRSIVALAEARFRQRGVLIAESPAEATAIATVSVKVDGGRQVARIVDVPIQGVTGYRRVETTRRDRDGERRGRREFRDEPIYGTVGYRQEQRIDTLFEADAQLGISRTGGRRDRIFEARVQSTGPCGLLAALAPVYIDALFAVYPAGGATTVESALPDGC